MKTYKVDLVTPDGEVIEDARQPFQTSDDDMESARLELQSEIAFGVKLGVMDAKYANARLVLTELSADSEAAKSAMPSAFMEILGGLFADVKPVTSH